MLAQSHYLIQLYEYCVYILSYYSIRAVLVNVLTTDHIVICYQTTRSQRRSLKYLQETALKETQGTKETIILKTIVWKHKEHRQ